ncbi:MAG TPA: galactokinase, partial [Clostridiales bacterium]|nr:galactokinase [Clostridiales bacterium]
MKATMLKSFKEVFGGEESPRVFFAPGRVNMIGEHTDYNGGHVFPCALTIGTYAAVRLREDRQLNFYSMNFEELGVIRSSLDELVNKKEDNWANYPKGILWALGEHSYKIDRGFDIVYYGNIPNAS